MSLNAHETISETEFIKIWEKFGHSKTTTLNMYRVLWAKCFSDAKTVDEIAEKLGFSHSKVKRILYRMRKKNILNSKNKLLVSKDFPKHAYIEIGMLGSAYEGLTQISTKEEG